jgi:glycosyltransferase involved in cell wall biosynthesis
MRARGTCRTTTLTATILTRKQRMTLSAFITAVIPALDEEDSVAAVVRGLFAAGIQHVIVADNGSCDATVANARAAGAHVVHAARRGYGSACQVGLAAVPAQTHAVLFCDADGADDLTQLPALLAPLLRDEADLVIGSRVLGQAQKGALTPPQRMGNFVAAWLMRVLYRVRVTDLGPFRCVTTAALRRMAMCDPAFGWTAEMQVKAFRLRLRVREIPVNALLRTAGESKISGNWRAVFRAGWAIMSTILWYWRAPLPTVAPKPVTTASAGSISDERATLQNVE